MEKKKQIMETLRKTSKILSIKLLPTVAELPNYRPNMRVALVELDCNHTFSTINMGYTVNSNIQCEVCGYKFEQPKSEYIKAVDTVTTYVLKAPADLQLLRVLNIVQQTMPSERMIHIATLINTGGF